MRVTPSPGPWTAYARALLSRKPRVAAPGQGGFALERRAAGIRCDPRRLATYRDVCGFAAGPDLPVTYPHVLAWPLHLALLTAPELPVRALGLVHLRNRIDALRPLPEGVPLELRARLSGPREAGRGQELDLVTEAWAAGELAWQEEAVLLARRPGAGRGPPAPGDADPAGADERRWEVPAATGRRYARASGDFNPIHLSALTARAFGFERAIAHGMWSLARIAAELGPGLPPGPVRLDASFRAPVLLPAAVTLRRWEIAEGLGFALRDRGGSRPHVLGALTTRP
ncbi:MaoC domain protein dehydratase [Anaeromyxobacter dehalogenans 2CP-1]|uniref:MaoC domain protein dehydratase n=1 Tax=Anaeromyxobacter dehalogenans (strain ATCC BAA-258 / DSM 21875 / 2CP-1) TaxID=455488 RepID=B8J6C1_ANAD2|nr:MaoC/PaaZ C-terminal domain-containing protein [Anaeromyxobacter dehalogenans]ACL65102.1 MaoC domain protein dehydratase [Anaeromyxobacter dehalogenans 2CP-1]